MKRSFLRKSISVVMILTMVMSISAMSFADKTYMIKQGDTLANISSEVGVSVEDLVMYNKIENPNMIMSGDVLQLEKMFDQVDLNEEYIMALAWLQDSAEFTALSHQAFNMAKMMVDMDLANNKTDEKRAIVVDCDETVIDNSYFNASFVGNDGKYSSTTWNAWVNDEEATAMPGAVEFLNYAVEKGYDVFYVTNRKAKYDLLEPTMKNLEALGFPQVKEDHMMLRTAESGKKARRDKVLETHRIVLLMGDNLNDFSEDFEGKTNDERKAEVEKMKAEFGKKFIVLPNPIYGDWEPGLGENYWGADEEGKSKIRQDALKKWDSK